MNWVEVCVVTDGEAAEAVSEALLPFAYQQSVVLEQRGDAASVDPLALEPTIAVKIYLPDDAEAADTRQRIREALHFLGMLYPIPEPSFRVLEAQDWENAWKAHYAPFRVGHRLWIQPSWQPAGELAADDIALTLDPGMAFGTGLHPTTQMCLQALERHVRPGDRVLDVGAGSGILSIAAARLGAASVVAVDTDTVAVATARENVARNGVVDRVEVRRGSLSDVSSGPWDVVVVNILAPVIVAMLQREALLNTLASDGRLILSGIIDDQAPAVAAAIVEAGGRVVETLAVRDWVSTVAERAEG